MLSHQEWNKTGNAMYELMRTLFPICRSITGNGVRKSLDIIKEHVPIKIVEVPTGTKAFDWKVPKEWNITDAYIKNSKGNKIVDFKNSNLHLVNYSIPVNKKLSLGELKKHLYTLPDHPDWIPYVTSYYNENWGFCLTHNQFIKLEEDTYEVFIDSTLENGHLTYGEFYLEGINKDEILLTCYICHPSLCNDNLSGPVLITYIAKNLIKLRREGNLKNSYRFLFIPETIGAIVWLSQNEDRIKNIKYGIVATCVGDKGKTTYKRTRIGNTEIDRIVEKVLIDSKKPYEIIDFFPLGSDERQFCSPGFNLPVGSLVRTLYAHFPEYHTSSDNLSFVKPQYLADSFKKYMKIIFILENNKKYKNLNPKCEPQLGRRGVYDMLNDDMDNYLETLAIHWILNLSDGYNSLLDISIRSDISFDIIKKIADILFEKNLIKEIV